MRICIKSRRLVLLKTCLLILFLKYNVIVRFKILIPRVNSEPSIQNPMPHSTVDETKISTGHPKFI